MPLPSIPETYHEDAYSGLLRHLPNNWFHELTDRQGALFPVIWGLAGVLAQLRISYEHAQDAAIPMRSGGPWLSLHLKSIGLDREIYETDEQAKERYQWEFKHTRNTREGLLRTIAHRTGLEPPQIRLEGDRSEGLVGQFRIVIDDREKPWTETDLGFVGELIRRYVANGIIPGLRTRLQCLLAAPLPPWQFYHQFPTSFTTQGPIWERPAFITPLRLDFSQNLFTQVSDDEWRENRDRLRKLHGDSMSGGAPGALFLYLSDPGHCPHLVCDYDLNLITTDPGETFPEREWFPDGYQFHFDFPRLLQAQGNFTAPFLSVPQGGLVQAIAAVQIPNLEDSPNWIGAGSATDKNYTEYRGIDFTRLQITHFADITPPSTGGEHNSPELTAMRSGPWQLAIGDGDPRWGNSPPQGSAFVSENFVVSDPVSIWWTDEKGDARSPTAIFDGDAVYLAIEYFFPATIERTIREVELRLQGQRVDYRRLSLPVDADVNLGLIFKIKGFGISQVIPSVPLLTESGSPMLLENDLQIELE